jgi:site-specific DNA recombinase
LVERYETIKKEIVDINDKRLERNAKRESIRTFIRTLEQSDTLLTEFDEELWNAVIEAVMVYQEQKICFIFKDGRELEWRLSKSNSPYGRCKKFLDKYEKGLHGFPAQACK